jgi:glutaminase
METINVNDLISYCEKAADVALELVQKTLDSKRQNTGDISAIAYFMQREALFRYEIPGIIKSYIAEQGESS